jgi:glycosyltransferase involved in cell wall biosynthesis
MSARSPSSPLPDSGRNASDVGSDLLSVVVPVFNENDVLEIFHRRLSEVLDGIDLAREIIYVNDGSSDGTDRVIDRLREMDGSVACLHLSRNFGKEVAMAAGFDHATGSAVVVIDADLQDPPELIPELVQRWQEGFDVVYAQRSSRQGESMLKRATASLFYRLMQHLGRVSIPKDTGDFRLLSRAAVDAVCRFREHHRFMKGLFTWIGFRQTSVLFERAPRLAGDTKWNYWRLWNFSLEGITSFTTAPLRLATYVGLLTALFAGIYAVVVVVKTLLYGDPVMGYPSLMTVMLLLGGIQLTALGVIGEYLGRVFNETKRRPLYFVQRFDPTSAAAVADGTDAEAERSRASAGRASGVARGRRRGRASLGG